MSSGSSDTTPPGSTNWVKITNIYSGDCVGVAAAVWVDYSNATLLPAAVGVKCGGASIPPDQAAPPGTGSLKFLLNHPGASAGHTVTANLKQRGAGLASDSVSPVGIGAPCPLSISGLGEIAYGFPTVDLKATLSGTFDRNKGNRVLVLVEQPAKVEGGNVPAPLLVYAAPADVDLAGKEATWKHGVIQVAKRDMLLRVVLTKDGVVVATVRAIFN